MRRILALALLLLVAAPAWAARPHRKHAPVARHRAPARHASGRPHRHVKLGLVPHHKGVANLFWMTKPIESERKDPSMDGTVHKSLPLD